MQMIKTECYSCDGTGLYQGFAEPKDVAVVCLKCNGTGCEELHYKPFSKRKGRRGVTKVSRSRGSFIGTGIGAVGRSITYKEFANGKMP